ncbi:hypothetical protein RHGRI_007845 [Rhododendron griersonianum]|uniref:Uncharacterized protein n=1 Tax=Rhododendron griersonianum TaxID=479676 RepID=A0AAV6L188_9ERIC|nr:hypothetical protein RHGRI_007845 [Rhododendron griersonianum]
MADGTISVAEGLGIKALDSNELRKKQKNLVDSANYSCRCCEADLSNHTSSCCTVVIQLGCSAVIQLGCSAVIQFLDHLQPSSPAQVRPSPASPAVAYSHGPSQTPMEVQSRQSAMAAGHGWSTGVGRYSGDQALLGSTVVGCRSQSGCHRSCPHLL